MNTTLTKLKKRHVSGISARDFPVGYRLSAQIHKLRDKGYMIQTVQSPDRHTLCRYVLIKKGEWE